MATDNTHEENTRVAILNEEIAQALTNSRCDILLSARCMCRTRPYCARRPLSRLMRLARDALTLQRTLHSTRGAQCHMEALRATCFFVRAMGSSLKLRSECVRFAATTINGNKLRHQLALGSAGCVVAGCVVASRNMMQAPMAAACMPLPAIERTCVSVNDSKASAQLIRFSGGPNTG